MPPRLRRERVPSVGEQMRSGRPACAASRAMCPREPQRRARRVSQRRTVGEQWAACRASRRSGPMPRIGARSWPSGASNRGRAGSWTSSSANRARAASVFNRAGGWSKVPSHTTYNPLLTANLPVRMIGLAGLLNLLEVVSRLQTAQQECACAPQEAGVPCLSSPPHPSSRPALPPAQEGATAQSVGPVTYGQPATTSAAAESPRRTAVRSAGRTAGHRQRGGQP